MGPKNHKDFTMPLSQKIEGFLPLFFYILVSFLNSFSSWGLFFINFANLFFYSWFNIAHFSVGDPKNHIGKSQNFQT